MNSKNIADIISTVGFPILCSLYFMFRLDKRVDKILELLGNINDHTKGLK